MSLVSWDRFNQLPGAATTNFERLCRAVVQRHYGRFGEFRYTRNQPGIEFSLLLHTDCDQWAAGSCVGWQCRWYALPADRPIGTARRQKILEALRMSEQLYPELTHWTLCTRERLSASDQDWYYSIPTALHLEHWTNEEIEERLNGPALSLRESFFAERMLTGEVLGQLHQAALHPIRSKWIPQVHVVTAAEREIGRLLLVSEEWALVEQVCRDLEHGLKLVCQQALWPAALNVEISSLKLKIQEELQRLRNAYAAVRTGDVAALAALEVPVLTFAEQRALRRLISRLRSFNSPASITVSNLATDSRTARRVMDQLRAVSSQRIVAVSGGPGQGKSELAIRLTQSRGQTPAGILLMASRLRSRGTLDELAQTVAPRGEPYKSFEALVEALDAAAQRAECRLPIVIDSLGEAEQPRDWVDALAMATPMLERFPHVLLVVTLRTEFESVCLPQDTEVVELNGFRDDAALAVKKYFAYYNIDAELGEDTGVLNEFLEHPLLLRMFCEVTNPDRKHPVSAAGMPGSLTSLFDRLLDQVASRVSEQTPAAARLYQTEVRAALTKIGRVLWAEGKRFVDTDFMRQAAGDAGRDWHTSVIRLLESEGLLIRNARPDADNLVGFAYDMVGGHVIAEALLKDNGQAIGAWFRSSVTSQKLFGPVDAAHPLRVDVFQGLVGLAPRRLQGEQLWMVIPPEHKQKALVVSMELEISQLDEETVNAIRQMLIEDKPFPARVFDNLRRTRALPQHPLNAAFLDRTLRLLPNAERDVYWTEWVRGQEAEIQADLEATQCKFEDAGAESEVDLLRARWTCWVLTSTVRPLRDQATRTLAALGCAAYGELATLALDCLAVTDPYVPERVMCAAYGAALAALAALSEASRAQIVWLARELYSNMFKPGAPYPTRHALLREYALGIISIARMLEVGLVDASALEHLRAPFAHLPSAFEDLSGMSEDEIAEADRAAIRMDFGNYTMGRLVEGRGNYDMDHAEFRSMRRDIVARMIQLGYSRSAFEAVDRRVTERSGQHGRGDHARVERYGKKYSWIALFEMYGLRSDQGRIPDYRAGERCVEADLDPCFPGEHRQWTPRVKQLFARSMGSASEWLAAGATPDYEHLMELDEVDGLYGPWVLIDGYLSELSSSDHREVFTFIHSVLVSEDDFGPLMDEFESSEYPGNSQVPAGNEHHYRYLGEMPFARSELPLGLGQLESQGESARAFVRFERGSWQEGIGVVPATQTYSWESYHSRLNRGGGATLPCVTICTALGLRFRTGSFDLVDDAGIASLFRAVSHRRGGEEVLHGHVCYLRADLLKRFMSESRLQLVTFIWGERGFHYRSHLSGATGLQAIYASHKHIHKKARVWRSAD